MFSYCLIFSPKDVQLQRICRRNPWLSEEAALARIEAQLPLEEKRHLADFVIDNSLDRKMNNRQGKSAVDNGDSQILSGNTACLSELERYSFQECRSILTKKWPEPPIWYSAVQWSLIVLPIPIALAYFLMKK